MLILGVASSQIVQWSLQHCLVDFYDLPVHRSWKAALQSLLLQLIPMLSALYELMHSDANALTRVDPFPLQRDDGGGTLHSSILDI